MSSMLNSVSYMLIEKKTEHLSEYIISIMYSRDAYTFVRRLIADLIFWAFVMLAVLSMSLSVLGDFYALRKYEINVTTEDTARLFRGLFS